MGAPTGSFLRGDEFQEWSVGGIAVAKSSQDIDRLTGLRAFRFGDDLLNSFTFSKVPRQG